MQRLGRFDAGAYLKAIVLLVRNPSVILAPLLMEVVGILLGMLARGSDPITALTGGLASFVVFLLDMFGLGVSLIIADLAWRRGRASFDEGWIEARRKTGDIFFAAIGFNFVLFVAITIGGIFGGVFSYLTLAAAVYFLIYTIPAAAIGGIPGGAALQVSIERVQRSYLSTFLLCVVCIAAYAVLPLLLAPVPLWSGSIPPLAVTLLIALVKAIAIGYVALVLAKNYNEVSYGRVR